MKRYGQPITPDSPSALTLMSRVRNLESRGAPQESIDAAYDAYWEQVDRDRAENRQAIIAEWQRLAAEAKAARDRDISKLSGETR